LTISEEEFTVLQADIDEEVDPIVDSRKKKEVIDKVGTNHKKKRKTNNKIT
jgi:hypothetical protein